MKVEGYCGICAACFEPIKDGDEFKFNEKGRQFHKHCAKEKPDNYYVKLEQIKTKFESADQKELTKLMDEMEEVFKIPILNNESFNQDNEEVIELYRAISNSREF